MSVSCQEEHRVCSLFVMWLYLPSVSMGKLKIISAASSLDGRPWRFTTLTVSVQWARLKVSMTDAGGFGTNVDIEGTYFLLWWEQCLCPVGSPVLPWGLHSLQTERQRAGSSWNFIFYRHQQRNRTCILPGTDTSVPFSSTISNLSCWLLGGFPLLQCLTPTHSWGNSSVTNTSSSNIGRDSGSFTAICCMTNRRSWCQMWETNFYIIRYNLASANHCICPVDLPITVQYSKCQTQLGSFLHIHMQTRVQRAF